MNNKKLRKSLIALGLVAIVGIGGTLAYFSQKTEEKQNVFTMGAGLTGELKEPAWDNVDFGGGSAGIEEGKLGEKLAENFTPGLEIPKDPAIKNTTVTDEGKAADAWVAIKIKYVGADRETATTYAALDKFINVTFGDKWTLNDDKTIAYYNVKLTAGETTQDLFSKVVIDNKAITQSQYDNEQYNQSLYSDVDPASNYIMSNFNIELQGYLVQTDGFNNAQAAMAAAYPDEF